MDVVSLNTSLPSCFDFMRIQEIDVDTVRDKNMLSQLETRGWSEKKDFCINYERKKTKKIRFTKQEL